MKGRKPKPANLRLIEGNREHRPIGSEPKPANLKPKPPKWLCLEAKIAFKSVCRELESMNLLYQADTWVICSLALSISDLESCRIEYHMTGSKMTIEGANHTKVLNPLLRFEQRTIAIISRLCAQLALDPTARARLTIQPPDETKSLREELMG